jgi:ElaB/YqjD/DUF883 family membrane-anchored ribosome-binding protein
MRDTIELAREAEVSLREYYDETGSTLDVLRRFEALVRADERDRAMRENAYVQAEREACAKVADRYVGADPIAAAIRARGNT